MEMQPVWKSRFCRRSQVSKRWQVVRFTIVVAILLLFANVKESTAQVSKVDNANTPEISADEKSEVIQGLCRRLTENYVFPEIAEKIVDHVKTKESDGGYSEFTTAKRFASELTEDLRSINDDRHLQVWLTPPQASTDETNLGTEFSRSRGKHGNYGFADVKVLPGNVGYIRMSSFSLDQLYDEAQGPATAAMSFVANSDALILDLRDNGGGSPRLARFLASYLYSAEPVHLNDYYFRTSDSTLEYWTLDNVPGVRLPEISVFILINKQTFSAAEGFAYNLKHLNRATIVGETSGGGAHGGSTHTVTGRFQAYIPFSRSIHPVTKTDFEGVGVVPDVKVNSKDALLASHILAIESLKKTELNEVNGDVYNKTLVTLKAEQNPVVLSNAELQNYAGVYQIAPQQSLEITIRDGKLIGQMTGDEKKVSVSPITKTRFRADDYQVEFTFELDDQGKSVGLTIHQGNGLKAKKVNPDQG